MALPRIRVHKNCIKPIQQGHPWLYKGSLLSSVSVGSPMLLVDEKNKVLAFALADRGDIEARILSKTPDKIPDLLRKRILVAQSLRNKVVPPNTTAYRLINGAGDGLPGIVVDMYNDLAVVKIYSASWEPHLDAIVDVLDTLPNVNDVYRRFGVRNVDGKKGGMLLCGRPIKDLMIIQEHGLRFLVRPKIGQKTGLFLDQREHRAFIGSKAKDEQVVNLFSYTGGFSVYAAVGGAKRVYSVDISQNALDDAKENFRLNGLSPDQHAFIATDVFQWKADLHAGIVICDPPSLSHKKKSDTAAMQSYTRLAGHSASMVPRGGLLALASCSARLNQKQWESASVQGIRKHGRWSWLWRANEPPDHPVSVHHPEGRYLKFSLLFRQR
ncbi:MAG: class I SAM-dependent rRNA methyltransferase [Myxococcota bacterium]|nr:class I SAM-dependent rRNA methyltransferase [Myxococcota bacterium]